MLEKSEALRNPGLSPEGAPPLAAIALSRFSGAWVALKLVTNVCDSGGMRRTWLRELVNVSKRYLLAAAAHNLGRMLRKLFGVGKPKALQGEGGLAALVQLLIYWLMTCWRHLRAQVFAPWPGCGRSRRRG